MTFEIPPLKLTLQINGMETRNRNLAEMEITKSAYVS